MSLFSNCYVLATNQVGYCSICLHEVINNCISLRNCIPNTNALFSVLPPPQSVETVTGRFKTAFRCSESFFSPKTGTRAGSLFWLQRVRFILSFAETRCSSIQYRPLYSLPSPSSAIRGAESALSSSLIKVDFPAAVC